MISNTPAQPFQMRTAAKPGYAAQGRSAVVKEMRDDFSADSQAKLRNTVFKSHIDSQDESEDRPAPSELAGGGEITAEFISDPALKTHPQSEHLQKRHNPLDPAVDWTKGDAPLTGATLPEIDTTIEREASLEIGMANAPIDTGVKDLDAETIHSGQDQRIASPQSQIPKPEQMAPPTGAGAVQHSEQKLSQDQTRSHSAADASSPRIEQKNTLNILPKTEQIMPNAEHIMTEQTADNLFENTARLRGGFTVDAMTGLATRSVGAQPPQSLPLSSNLPSNPVLPSPQITQVTDSIIRAASHDKGLTVRLSPPEMGRVYIEFQFTDSQNISATLRAENPEMSAHLKSNSAVLQQILKDSGFSQINLHFSDSSGFQDQSERAFQEQSTALGLAESGLGEGDPALMLDATHLNYASPHYLMLDSLNLKL